MLCITAMSCLPDWLCLPPNLTKFWINFCCALENLQASQEHFTTTGYATFGGGGGGGVLAWIMDNWITENWTTLKTPQWLGVVSGIKHGFHIYRFFHKRIEVPRVFGDNLKTSRTFWNLHHGSFFHACKPHSLFVGTRDFSLTWEAILWHGFGSLSDGPRQGIFFLFWEVFYSTEQFVVSAFPFCLWLLGQNSPRMKWRHFNY